MNGKALVPDRHGLETANIRPISAITSACDVGAVSTKIYPKPFCTNVVKQKKLHNTNQHSSRKNMRYLYVYLLHFTDNHRKPHQSPPHVVSLVATVGSTFGSRYSIWFTVFIHWEKNPDISTQPFWFLHVRGVWVDGAYPISKFMLKKWHTGT